VDNNRSLSFGAQLRKYRRIAGLSQVALAQQAGVSPRTIGDMERGAIRLYRRDTVALLAEALGLSAAARVTFEEAAFAHDEAVRSAPLRVAHPAALPAQTTSFVGRADLTVAVIALLRQPTIRLVTLTGAPGVGKSRLALVVAAALAAERPNAVAVVALAPIRRPDLVVPTVAATLGVQEQRSRPLLETLVDYLRTHPLLLVLDNVEHVAAAVALLIAALPPTPRLRILATGRAALHVPHEHEVAVPPLDLPAPAEADPTVLLRSSAVTLFIDRARSITATFVPTPDVVRAVARACQRLDGLPLAIELAASWVGLLPPAELATRLPDLLALPLARAGAVERPAHQRTLWSMIAWSVDLLTPRDRALFRRLGVFAGDAGLAAVEVICADPPAPAGRGQGAIRDGRAVRAGLAALSAANLARLEPDTAVGDLRVGMMETVRAYAAELLETSGEAEAVRRRHLTWSVELAEAAEPHLKDRDQTMWLTRLRTEHHNLQAALHWARDTAAYAEGLRLAVVLGYFWSVSGQWSEGAHWLDDLLAFSADVATPLRARALNNAGNLAQSKGELAQARDRYEESLALRRELNDIPGIAGALGNLGNLAYRQGDYPRAWDLQQESLTLYRQAGARVGIADTLSNLGLIAFQRGDLARADELFGESLQLQRELGNVLGLANALCNVGIAAFQRGDLERVRPLLDEALTLYQDIEAVPDIASTLSDLGELAVARGDYQEALPLFVRSLSLMQPTAEEPRLLDTLEVVAVAIAGQQPLRAAHILAAIDMLHAALMTVPEPRRRSAHEAALATIRAALEEQEFARAWAHGQSLRLTEVIALALEIKGQG